MTSMDKRRALNGLRKRNLVSIVFSQSRVDDVVSVEVVYSSMAKAQAHVDRAFIEGVPDRKWVEQWAII